MKTNEIKIVAEISRAMGVMTTLYGIVRDMNIGNMVDKDENGKLGDVVSDCLNGLNMMIELFDSGDEDTGE